MINELIFLGSEEIYSIYMPVFSVWTSGHLCCLRQIVVAIGTERILNNAVGRFL